MKKLVLTLLLLLPVVGMTETPSSITVDLWDAAPPLNLQFKLENKDTSSYQKASDQKKFIENYRSSLYVAEGEAIARVYAHMKFKLAKELIAHAKDVIQKSSHLSNDKTYIETVEMSLRDYSFVSFTAINNGGKLDKTSHIFTIASGGFGFLVKDQTYDDYDYFNGLNFELKYHAKVEEAKEALTKKIEEKNNTKMLGSALKSNENNLLAIMNDSGRNMEEKDGIKTENNQSISAVVIQE